MGWTVRGGSQCDHVGKAPLVEITTLNATTDCSLKASRDIPKLCACLLFVFCSKPPTGGVLFQTFQTLHPYKKTPFLVCILLTRGRLAGHSFFI